VDGAQVKVTLVLTRGDQELAHVSIKGTTDDLNALATRLATEIDRRLTVSRD
jgi:hypothetical protein